MCIGHIEALRFKITPIGGISVAPRVIDERTLKFEETLNGKAQRAKRYNAWETSTIASMVMAKIKESNLFPGKNVIWYCVGLDYWPNDRVIIAIEEKGQCFF